jgi:hypothetical protein
MMRGRWLASRMRDRQPLVPAPLRLPAALREYLREEAADGIVLMAAAAARDAAGGARRGVAGRAAGARPAPAERVRGGALFALANAGVTVDREALAGVEGAGAVLGGIVLGRVVGKLAGIGAAV